MCSALFSVHGLKNEVYSCVAYLFRFMDKRTRYIDVWRACFGSWIKERVALVWFFFALWLASNTRASFSTNVT